MTDAFSHVIERTHSGKIRTRSRKDRNWVFLATTFVLLGLTIYTFVQMNYGAIDFSVAIKHSLSDFRTMMFEPRLNGHFSASSVLESMLVTIGVTLLTTLISAVISVVLGLFAAENLSNATASNIIKAVMSFIRAVPTVLWVLIFTVAIGLGSEAAVIGISFHSIAYLVKAYSESYEEIDVGVIEALRACGASWWQVVTQAVFPTTINQMLSWTFIRFEINFVNAVAVGAVAGAGGIGYQLFQAGSHYYDLHEVGLIAWLCLIVAAVLEYVSIRLRRRYILAES